MNVKMRTGQQRRERERGSDREEGMKGEEAREGVVRCSGEMGRAQMEA